MKSNPVSQVNEGIRGCTRHLGSWNLLVTYYLGLVILCTISTTIYVSSTIDTGQNTCYLLLVFSQVWRFDCYGELLDETCFIARKLRFMQIHVLSHNLI